jgi:hypothetical protein
MLQKQKITKRYLPSRLTRSDRKKQANMLKKSRKLYKKGIYYTRKRVESYPHKNSNHVIKAKRIYNVDTLDPSSKLANKTGCSINALKKIVNKGEGAYFSSGSRPNHTGQSWGIARLASSITGGKAAAVDYSILEMGCNPKSRALHFAKLARKKYGFGKHRVPKTTM